MDSTTEQMAYFRQKSEQEFDIPGRGLRRYTASTMKSWLYNYRRRGFQALMPKCRADIGGFRTFAPETREKTKTLRQEHLHESCTRFYDRCIREQTLGDPPICIETLRRFLKLEGLYKISPAIQARKRFEMRYFGELWTCDFMHGPQATHTDGKRKKRAILMAIIDDHSRIITGFQWAFAEDTKLVESVFKNAILTHGIPDRLYCDNGSAFSSQYLSLVCAHLNIGLVHSKPYDSPSRGKIERFFRTVRQCFLPDVKEDDNWTLERLNESFRKWIHDYHHRNHHGIAGRPIDRLQISTREYPRKRIDQDSLDEHFLVTTTRCVSKDSTVSLNSVVFEVPPQFIDQKVELKFKQDQPGEVFLYRDNRRITRITPVDSQLNGMTYKPGPRISDVALHSVMRGEK
jgi:transposase InsO family protein